MGGGSSEERRGAGASELASGAGRGRLAMGGALPSLTVEEEEEGVEAKVEAAAGSDMALTGPWKGWRRLPREGANRHLEQTV